MVLKPQDVLVLLKLVAIGPKPWSYAWLAVQLEMSPSQLHSAVRRVLAAGLAVRQGDKITPHLRNIEELLIHGVKYVFVPERGELTRGMPTAHAAPPLSRHFRATDEPPPVWPDPDGQTKGIAFSPLYKLVPDAAKADSKLYELLVIVDAIRGGRAREQAIGIKELKQRLKAYGPTAESKP
jgi:hypothetical protein